MCTDFILPQMTGQRVSGRSMDFATQFTWQIAAAPVGISMTAYSEEGQQGKAAQWTSRYAFIGIGADTFGLRVNDALNTEGFSAGGLWLADSRYPNPDDVPSDASLLSAVDIVAWAASNYATVAELADDLRAISKGQPTRDGSIVYFWNPFQYGPPNQQIPLHFQFHDAKGDSLVLEFWNGIMQVTDNADVGVMTNGPSIDWHKTNLQNYLAVTNINKTRNQIIGLQFNMNNDDNAFGDGTLPLSNSPTSTSRFVRTTMLMDFAIPWLGNCSVSDAEAFAFNVLGNVTATHLSSVTPVTREDNYTQWVVVRNHATPKLYIRTADGLGTWGVNFSDYALGPNNTPQYALLTNCTQAEALIPKQ